MARTRHTRHRARVEHVPTQASGTAAISACDLAHDIVGRLNEADHAFRVDVFDEDEESQVEMTDDATCIIETMIANALRAGGVRP